MMLLYLSGPLSDNKNGPQAEHVAKAAEAFIDLTKEGIVCFCPHLSAYAPKADDVAYDQWITADLAILGRCDAVLMLEGWEESKGARIEYERAKALGKPIIHDRKEIEGLRQPPALSLSLSRPLCILDLETTGLDTEVARIIEIGLMVIYPEGSCACKADPECLICK